MESVQQPVEMDNSLLHHVLGLWSSTFCAPDIVGAIDLLSGQDSYSGTITPIQGDAEVSSKIKEYTKRKFGLEESQIVLLRIPNVKPTTNYGRRSHGPNVMTTIGLLQDIMETTGLRGSDVSIVVPFEEQGLPNTTESEEYDVAKDGLRDYYSEIPNHPKPFLASRVASVGVYNGKSAPIHQTPFVLIDLFLRPGVSTEDCGRKLIHALSRAQYAAILIVHDDISGPPPNPATDPQRTSAFPDPLAKLVGYAQQRSWNPVSPRSIIVPSNLAVPEPWNQDPDQAAEYKNCILMLHCFLENNFVSKNTLFYIAHLKSTFLHLKTDYQRDAYEPILEDALDLTYRHPISYCVLLRLLRLFESDVKRTEQEIEDFYDQMYQGFDDEV